MMELKDEITLVIIGGITSHTNSNINKYLAEGFCCIYSGWVDSPLQLTHENLTVCYSNYPAIDLEGRNGKILNSAKGLSNVKTRLACIIGSDENSAIDCISSFAKHKNWGAKIFTKCIYKDIPLALDLSVCGPTKDLKRMFSCDIDDKLTLEPETYIVANYLDFYSTAVMNMRLNWQQFLTEDGIKRNEALLKSEAIMNKYFEEFESA